MITTIKKTEETTNYELMHQSSGKYSETIKKPL